MRWLFRHPETIVNYILRHPEIARKMFLTRQQLQIYKWCLKNKQRFHTAEIADHFKITAQHAYAVCEGLRNKGYLVRIKKSALTGGPEYEYSVRDLL